MIKKVTLSVLVAGLLGFGGAAQAATVYSIDTLNRLSSFDHTAPSTVTPVGPVTGLAGGEVLLGIDFRPATDQLYGIGSQGTLYTIDKTTGAATPVGAAGSIPLSGSSFGFDFNPTVDRIRVVSNADQNIRLNPITGAVAATDPNLTYGGSPNPNVVAVAYTNNDTDPTTATSLFGIDWVTDMVVSHSGPAPTFQNLVPLFSLSANTSDQVGFDIAGPAAGGNSLALASLTGGTVVQGSFLYLIDIPNSTVSFVGLIGDGTTIRDIAIDTTPIPLPAAAWLLLSGIAGIASLSRRKKT